MCTEIYRFSPFTVINKRAALSIQWNQRDQTCCDCIFALGRGVACATHRFVDRLQVHSENGMEWKFG